MGLSKPECTVFANNLQFHHETKKNELFSLIRLIHTIAMLNIRITFVLFGGICLKKLLTKKSEHKQF